jgi:hypothetical protein
VAKISVVKARERPVHGGLHQRHGDQESEKDAKRRQVLAPRRFRRDSGDDFQFEQR